MRQTTPRSAARFRALQGWLLFHRAGLHASSCAWCIPFAGSHSVVVLRCQWAPITGFCGASSSFIWWVGLCVLVSKRSGGGNMSLVLSNASILRNKSSSKQVSSPPRLSFSLIALGLYFIICFSSTFTPWKQVLAVEVFCLWPSSCWFALLVGYQPRKNNPDFLMISCTCICFADTWTMTVMCGPCMSSLFLISQPSSTQNLWRSSTPQCVVVILPALKAYVFFFKWGWEVMWKSPLFLYSTTCYFPSCLPFT